MGPVQNIRSVQVSGSGKTIVHLKVNGLSYYLDIEPRTLLDTLRTELGLTGTKKVCGSVRCL